MVDPYGDPWGFHAIKTLTIISDNVADQFIFKLFKCIIYSQVSLIRGCC